MQKYDAIFMMGPQGSGKGTQAKILAEKLGFFHWEMGGILRGMKEHKFANGETVGGIMERGNYLSDEQLLEIIPERLAQIPPEQGIIFDALPRRIGQAEFIMDWLHSHNKNSLLTIMLALPREESFKRLSLRAQIEKRADDTPEAIESRLRLYEEATLPILDYMKEHTEYIELDGKPSIPEVTKEIDQALGLNA